MDEVFGKSEKNAIEFEENIKEYVKNSPNEIKER